MVELMPSATAASLGRKAALRKLHVGDMDHRSIRRQSACAPALAGAAKSVMPGSVLAAP